jgi:formylglycine-generating enzyme required for sulfatase activity
VTESPLILKDWAEALRPIAPTLLPTLASLAADSRGLNERRTTAELYAAFAAGVSNGFAPLEAVLEEPPGDGQDAAVALARRKATAAAALARAGRWQSTWPLLRSAPDPTLRSYLIERLGVCSGPGPVAARLISGEERDAAVRQALILALGEFGEERFSAEEKRSLVRELLHLYRDDPDPGIHVAASWLLESFGETAAVEEVDESLATGTPQGKRRWYVTREGQTMVLVAPGEIDLSENPDQRRRLRVDRPLAIASCEITLDEFHRFRKEHAADRQSAPTGDCAVNEVSWFDVAAYCNWLSEREGVDQTQWCYSPNQHGEYSEGMTVKPNALALTGYRLPTIEEWELACRAGSVTRWPMGDAAELLTRYAWYSPNSGMRIHPVGALRPNDLGLFDTNGNVWEWCQSGFKDSGEPAEPGADESDLVDGATLRALRGGTYLNDVTNIGSTAEIRNAPYSHTGADGFRVARTMPR